jgi:glyoxylase-like metal-dependent hydrolase (beta-lactamase superfamily II)
MRFNYIVVFSLFCILASPLIKAEEPSSAISIAPFCKNLPRPEYANLKRVDIEHDWFEVYQVAEGVKAIYEPFQWQEVISYLIEGEDKALLFDTGNGIADIHALVKRLTHKPISVLNSHSHYDHVGGNHAFEKIYGLNTHFTAARQAGQPNSNIGIEVSEQALCKKPPAGVTPETHIGRPYTITHKLTDGAIIGLGNRTLEIMHIPGHTPDAIALLDRKAGLMWTGDSFYLGPIWLYAPETNLSDYKNSIEKLVEQVPNLKALLPAHNTPWVDPKILIKVEQAFHTMLNGKGIADRSGEGTAEYTFLEDNGFSFLLRDEPLPYASDKEQPHSR